MSSDTDAGRVDLVGELDLMTADHVAEVLGSLHAQGCRRLTVDLSGVAFLGLAGLTVLAEAHRRFEEAGGRLTLTGCRPIHLRLFAVTGFDKTFHLVDGATPGRLDGG